MTMLQVGMPAVLLQGGVHYLLYKWSDILMTTAGRDTNIDVI